MSPSRICCSSVLLGACSLIGLPWQSPARGDWQAHWIRQGDGRGGWTNHPAMRQVLKHPDSDFTMPFGLVEMDNGEIAILCSREKQPAQGSKTIEPIIAFSKDGGATWSSFTAVPGARGRPQYFAHLGGGRLSLEESPGSTRWNPRNGSSRSSTRGSAGSEV